MTNKSAILQAVNTIMYLTGIKRKIVEKWIYEHYPEVKDFNKIYFSLNPTSMELGGCLIENRNIKEYLHKIR